MGTYLSTPVTEKGTEQSGEDDDDDEIIGGASSSSSNCLHCPITPCAWGVVDMQGWRKSMEDAHVARTNVDIPEHLLSSQLLQSSSLLQNNKKNATVKKHHAKAKVFGVFDGHGGPEVARFCQLYLVSVLTHQPSWRGRQEAAQALVSDNNNTAAASTDVDKGADADNANNNNNNAADNLSDVGKALRMCFHALDRLIDDPSRREELVRLRAIKPGPGEYRDIDHVDHIPPPVELVGQVSAAAAPPANANNDDDDDIPAGAGAAAAKEEDNNDDDEADATTTTTSTDDDDDDDSPSSLSSSEDKSAATATADTAAASEQENAPDASAKSEENMNDDSSSNNSAAAQGQEESSLTRPSTNETAATPTPAVVVESGDDALAAKMQEEEEEAKKDAVDDDKDDNDDVAAASDYSDDSEQAVGLDEAAELDRDLMDEDDDDDDDDENAEANDTTSSTAPVMIMDDENDGGEIEHTPLPPPPPVPESPQSMGTAGKVSTMFQRLLNLSGTPPTQGQVAVDLNHSSSGSSSAAIIDATSPPPPPPPPPLPPGAKTNGPCASLPTIVQNGRMICNLPDHPIHAGATAIVAVICGKTLTVANAGDSRAVLCRKGGQAMALSFDHKPQQDTELTRIHRAGGFVNHFGRVNGNLNLSRSIGDLKYKQVPGIRPRDQMISAEPDIVEVQLQDDDEFIILGCDGIWDCLSNEQAVDYVRRRIHVQTPTEIGVEMLDEIISTDPRVTQGIGGDNMTLMIIDLQPHSRSYRKASSGSPHTTGGDGDGGGDASSNKNNLDEEASSRL